MIYLTTGANGAGKTLLTLRDVQEKSVKESRPVYHNGRFEIVPGGPLDGWTKFETKDWQAVPDGAIFVIDECHNEGDFPVRTDKTIPEYVKQMAEHRRRGFDFYLITQHPMNIDPFVRRLIGSPGWHRHLKRASGAALVSVLTWAAVNDQPQKNGSGASAQTSMVSYPKEVYNWYKSTSLDTAKTVIPFQVKLLVFALVAVPVLGYFGWKTMAKRYEPKTVAAVSVPGVVSGAQPGQISEAKKPVTAVELAASYVPRFEGLPQTAPRYDDLTKPVNVPYPAACIQMGSRCECYTQQATKIPVPMALCVQIVKGGFFNDWQQAVQQASSGVYVPPKGATPVQVQNDQVVGPIQAVQVSRI